MKLGGDGIMLCKEGVTMKDYARHAGNLLSRVRSARPVVHSITNYVVMNSTANVLLAMGASPIMAHALEEMEDICAISSSLVVNIGTLSHAWIDSMSMACRIAARTSKPFVLDPVGAGASRLRTETALGILQNTPPTVMRGNASEILSLAKEEGYTRGVDSVHRTDQAIASARSMATATKVVVAVTGETDIVTDGEHTLRVTGGHPLMGFVTGTGCASSVIVGAFLAVETDAVIASASALAFFGLAAEMASRDANTPGTFWVRVLDHLYSITPAELEASATINPL